ncbi:FecR family protein [Luteolibacter soli]|uniref:FecR family protein n=1 Tax=Luteolibacter soli TaxID=3135280 RepID=A0ABU9ATT2_9BACT
MNDADRQLVDLYLDGELPDEEAARLMERIDGDPEAVGYLADRALLQADLRRSLKRQHLEQWAVASAASEKAGSRGRRPVWLALAACLALLIGGTMWWRAKADGVDLQVVHVEGAARLHGRGEAVSVGETLSLREIELESGFLRVRLENGVLLDLNGPLAANFESGMRMRLGHGRMSADVGTNGKGFTVVTDAGETVDLGTRFGVEADASGESRVAVFSGEVKVRSGGKGSEFTTLREGEAVKFTALAGLRRWTQVALAVDAAGLERTPADGVIESVRDNLGDEELHPFYGIVRGGMRPGALAFTDKPNPRWAPRTGDALPAGLLGADLVRTYHQFRLEREYSLTLTLRERAAVFVLIDARQELPPWLKQRFRNTGESVRVGPWMPGLTGEPGVELGEDGLPYLNFSVWRAEAEAGDIVLGRALRRRSKDMPFPFMYGVAVKALPSK